MQYAFVITTTDAHTPAHAPENRLAADVSDAQYIDGSAWFDCRDGDDITADAIAENWFAAALFVDMACDEWDGEPFDREFRVSVYTKDDVPYLTDARKASEGVFVGHAHGYLDNDVERVR